MATRLGSALALALLALMPGCAGRPYLHWQGGDTFSVFQLDGRAPSRIECAGTTEQRFLCFAARVRERVRDTSVALVIAPERGALLQTTATDSAQAFQTTQDTLFPLLSVTKMFTAATAVLLARDGVLDLHRPIATYLRELKTDSELGALRFTNS